MNKNYLTTEYTVFYSPPIYYCQVLVYISLLFQAAARLQVWGGLVDEIMGSERCDLECIKLYVESIDIEKVVLVFNQFN